MKRKPYISIKVWIKLYMKHRELDLKVKIVNLSEKLDILSTLNILIKIKLNNVLKKIMFTTPLSQI